MIQTWNRYQSQTGEIVTMETEKQRLVPDIPQSVVICHNKLELCEMSPEQKIRENIKKKGKVKNGLRKNCRTGNSVCGR